MQKIFEIRKYESSDFILFFFRIVFTYLKSLEILYEFSGAFSVLEKNAFGILIGIMLNL